MAESGYPEKSEWLDICGACEGCDGVDRLDEFADRYVHSVATIVSVTVATAEGRELITDVPNGSLKDLPREVEMRQVGVAISSRLLADIDPLRCADGCAVGPSPEKLFAAELELAKAKNRREFHQRIADKVTPREVFLATQPDLDLDAGRDAITEFVNGMFNETEVVTDVS